MRLVLVGLTLFLVSGAGAAALRLAAGVTVGVLALYWIARTVAWGLSVRRRRRAIRSAAGKARSLVAEHIDTLARRRLSLVRVDRYGVTDASAWEKEVRHFAENVLHPRLSRTERAEVERRGAAPFLRRTLEEPVAARARELARTLTPVEATDAAEFEAACASLLTRMGWRAEVTPASGDQGADIVAYKGRLCAVIQCKMHKGAVGNGAVQEVVGARLYYSADVAAVVATSGYTKSAVRLAEKCDVLLLGSHDVQDFDELLRGSAPAPEGARRAAALRRRPRSIAAP